MAITISPSPRTARAYRTHPRHAPKLDLAIIFFSLITLGFGIATGILAFTDNAGWNDSASPAYGTIAIDMVINMVTPAIAVLSSALNIYLFAYKSLRPWWIIVWGVIMTAGWIVTIGFWIGWNAEFTGPSFDYDGSNWTVTWGVVGPEVVFGIIAACLTIGHICMACVTLTRRRAAQSVAGAMVPPDYNDLSTHAPSIVTPDLETQDKKPELADACFCSRCGTIKSSGKRSSIATDAKRSPYASGV